MKIKSGTVWQRRGAPELRVVVDLAVGMGVKYTVTSTGVSQNMGKWAFQRKFEPAGE